MLAHFRLPLAQRLRSEGYEVVRCCPPGEYVAWLRAAGFEWVPWRLERRSMGALRELRALGELARLVQQQPDVAHAFTIKPVVYGSLVVAWRSLRRAATPRLLITNLTGLGYLFSDAPPARVVRVGLWPLLVGSRFGQGLVVGWRQRRRRAGGVLVGPLRWPAAGAVRRAAAGQQGGG